MAIAHDTTTTATAYTSTGTQTTSHAAGASARAAVVLIAQNASTADQVSGVTYGGLAMTRLRFDTEATEAGGVYIYWLDGITGGTQNVAMTTTGTANKQLSVSTMTVTSGARVGVVGTGNTATSAAATNPALTLSGLTASTPYQCYEVIHSGLQTMTNTPQTSPAWTLISSTDLGSQGRGFARIANTPGGTTITAGWIAATSEDYVISAVAFYELPAYTFNEPFDSGSSPWSFDTFNGTAGTVTLDTTNQLHGAGCLSVSTSANAGRLRINAANVPTTGKLYARFYLKVTSTPSSTAIIFKHSGTSGANLMQIGYGTGLAISVRDNAGAFSTSYTLTSGQWYRVEALHDMAATKIQMKVWASPESTGTPDFDSGLVTSTGTPDLVMVGQDSSVTSTHLIDEFALSSVDWLGPSVISVSASRGTTWNVAAPVSASRATTWAVRASVTPATRATTWTTAAQVASTRATSWAVRAAVAATRATTWTTRAGVTPATRATSWAVLGAVAPASRATTWTTRATTSSTRATTWKVAAQVASTRATTWAVRAAVTATRSTTWNVASALTPVSASRATTWHVRAQVASTRATTWATRAALSATRSTTWTVRTPVAGSRATTWKVAALVSASRATTWRTAAMVAASRSTSWAVLAAVAAQRSTTWLVHLAAVPGATVVVIDPGTSPLVVRQNLSDGVLVLADPRTVTVTDDPPAGVVVRASAAGAAVVRRPG